MESRVLVPCARRASGPCLLAAYSLDGAHNAGRRVVSEQGRSRMSRKKAGIVLDSAPPPCIMGATFGHPPAEGPGTYARERDPGRGSATGSRKVVPPAGPSHLTPSRPGEAKSRSDEAPRCPNQNENPNQKTAAGHRCRAATADHDGAAAAAPALPRAPLALAPGVRAGCDCRSCCRAR